MSATYPDRCPRCDRAECRRDAAQAEYYAAVKAYEAFGEAHPRVWFESPEYEPVTTRRKAASAWLHRERKACKLVDWRARCLAAESALAAERERRERAEADADRLALLARAFRALQAWSPYDDRGADIDAEHAVLCEFGSTEKATDELIAEHAAAVAARGK